VKKKPPRATTAAPAPADDGDGPNRRKEPAKPRAKKKPPPLSPPKPSPPKPPPPSPPKPPAAPDPAAYDRHKERARERNAEQSHSGRDIGALPAVVNRERKARAALDFAYFLKAYFPWTFSLDFASDHLKVTKRCQEAATVGGLFALAMPRGSGKTSICEALCVWATLYGHRRFIALIGADASAAAQMLDSIKTELEVNELLAEDFPEVCYPVGRLEGIANRCAGQLHLGERTHITWTDKVIVLPTIAGSPASGAIIKIAGITGRIRGMKFKRADGQSVRPDLAVVDDVQTDSSANSPAQCAKLERVLAGAVLGLAGPGSKIAGVFPCTVIREGDAADRILDRSKYPQWQGERMKMVYAWPERMDLWEEYGQRRREELAAGGDGSKATAWYVERRPAMDAGGQVAWEQRHNPDEVSALQHAMNLRFADQEGSEAAFFAEYQNDPLPPAKADDEDLTAEQIAGKFNGMARREVLPATTHLTAFVDVQQAALFYTVCAWEQDFTGYVVDYGTWPDQKRAQFTLRDIKKTLATETKVAGLEAQIYAGLEALADELLGREWAPGVRVERLLVDANWGQSTDVVKQWCRQTKYSASVMPSHGKYIGASTRPITDRKKKPGERMGINWVIPLPTRVGQVRHVLFDTNYWKSFLSSRLAVPMGGRGCLSLFGKTPGTHRLLAEHLTAEYRVKTQGRGREVDEWKARPGHPDNHWLDCVVGAAVAASIQGVSLESLPAAGKPKDKGKRQSFAERQREARNRRRGA
jgi:Phage terminase large subunit (GpA)